MLIRAKLLFPSVRLKVSKESFIAQGPHTLMGNLPWTTYQWQVGSEAKVGIDLMFSFVPEATFQPCKR